MPLKTPDIDYNQVGLLLHILKETHGYPKYLKLRTSAERELQNIEDECAEEMDAILAEERAGMPVVGGMPVSGLNSPAASVPVAAAPVGERILSPGTSDVGVPAPTQGALAFDGTPETTPGSDIAPPVSQNIVDTPPETVPSNPATSPASAGTPATTEDKPSMMKTADPETLPAEAPVVPRRV